MRPASRWTSQEVEEYLAKFKVEEMVQQAINYRVKTRKGPHHGPFSLSDLDQLEVIMHH